MNQYVNKINDLHIDDKKDDNNKNDDNNDNINNVKQKCNFKK